jgi:hypothetical protein
VLLQIHIHPPRYRFGATVVGYRKRDHPSPEFRTDLDRPRRFWYKLSSDWPLVCEQLYHQRNASATLEAAAADVVLPVAQDCTVEDKQRLAGGRAPALALVGLNVLPEEDIRDSNT